MKKNTRKTFYLMTFFAVAAMIAMGFLVVPNFNNSGTVSAQKAEVNTEVATADMIAIATNTKSAGSFAIFADRGISDTGDSQIKGNVGVAGKGAQVSLDRAYVQGNTYVDPSDALRAKSDLAASFNALNNLPCQEVADSELGGKRFTPGVYCFSSARLAGQVILDAENNPSGVFIFRVAGSFNTKTGSSIELSNQAVAGNVYFVASDSVNIGKGSTIQASIFAENDVKVDDGAAINGKILSLKGGVSLNNDSVQLVDGFIEICKVVNPLAPGNTDLANRIFQFSVTGIAQTIEVQEGHCAGPFLVPGAGNVVVTEANTSRLPGSSTLRIGNFQLTDVRQINRQPGDLNRVTAFNLPLRTANVNVPMGGINDQVTVQFTNQFAIVGFIEICKNGLDSDVTGTFTYEVDGVPQQTSLPPTPLQQFTVPTGACAGPIAVTVPSDGTGTPRSGIARVRELARVGFFFVMGTTDPPERLIDFTIVNNTSTAGFVRARVFEAGASFNQTRVNFFNRTNPAQIKVCKIAGAGIVEGTLFRFRVAGTAPVFDPVTGAFSTVAVTRDFNVAAGLAANNGGCRFVPTSDDGPSTTQQLFVVGTNATVTELSPLTINTNIVKVARITSSSGFTTVGTGASCAQATLPASMSSGPNIFFPTNGDCRTVVVPVRRQVVEVEYTNFIFRPGQLKICKVAGTGVPIDNSPTAPSNFTFNVTFDRLQGTIPGAPRTETITLTVPAGPAAQGGFCRVVNGPFTPTFGGFGAFNVGSVITVTETPAVAGTVVTGIRSTSGAPNPLTTDLPGRTATLRIIDGNFDGVNFSIGTTEIEFTNTASVPEPPARASTAYDFDGDLKADISVFRNGNWYLNQTKDGFTARQFGSAGDKLVTADYDGDGKADIAVFRAAPDPTKGYFYILNSSNGAFVPVQFGINTDVPVVGDYDGDGYADIAVYRDGKNAGDASYIYYRPSGTPGVDFVTIQLGAKGDIPVVGDYDADGKTDAAVFRPSNGTWYMLRSTAGFTGVQFGISTDVPVPADYDGDGKTDVAVYRGGTWYLLQSSKGFTGLQFGAATDMPIPADVDGDGKDDIVVFRAGTWYWLNSKDGSFQGALFGLSTDVPVFCPASHQ